MSAVYLKLLTVLCLACTALSSPGSSGVEWKVFGEAITIQCRYPIMDQESLSLKKGLTDQQVLFKDGKSEKNNTVKQLNGRLQLNGVFPNIDILIKNLTSSDTGPYWCIYTKFDQQLNKPINVNGSGSVLLVVTDMTQPCEESNNKLMLVSIVICATTLLGIIISFLTWLILKAKMCTAKKLRRVPNNEVYEDMRGTVRR